MRTDIALFEYFQRDDAHYLLLLYSCFFALCALVTLFVWIFTGVSSRGSRSDGGRSIGGKTRSHTQGHNSSGLGHSSSGLGHNTSGLRHDSSGLRHDSSGLRHDSSGLRHGSHAQGDDFSRFQYESAENHVLRRGDVGETLHASGGVDDLPIDQHTVSREVIRSEVVDHNDSTSARIFSSQRYDAISAFRTEIDRGQVRFDEDYSIVYNSQPNKIDDLRVIKGVSRKGVAHLNSKGCYCFKQIALWSPETCNKLNQELNADIDWVSQGHHCYRQKYGHAVEIPS